MRGDYSPGSPLGEVELARCFGVSRGPVREALIQLEREYLVRSFPNRGCFVTTLSEQEFDEIVSLRSVLEPIALHHARNQASSKDIADMRQRLRDLERVAAKRDQRAYISKDYAFHVAIWELSGQPLLTEGICCKTPIGDLVGLDGESELLGTVSGATLRGCDYHSVCAVVFAVLA